MTGSVIIINEDSQFQTEMAAAGSKLVVVDFHATWCGPCLRIAPKVEEFAAKYQTTVFMKVDVDQCQQTAAANNVTAMPTFIFFRNGAKIDMVRGADVAQLEEKIKKWSDPNDDSDETVVKGHMDLSSFISKSESECLNESDDHTMDHALNPKGGFLESDCDEQLIMSFTFTQAVKLHSLKLHGPPDKGPKNIKVFINQPRALDFDQAESMEPVQAFDLKPEDIESNGIIPLRFVKYQNVQSLTIFVKDNQGGEETTQIDNLYIFGSPIGTTNMSDFKRVAGKKGESH